MKVFRAISCLLFQQLVEILAFSPNLSPQNSFWRHSQSVTSMHVVEVGTGSDDTSLSSTSSESEETNIEFPPPLSKVDRIKRAAQFWSNAIPIVASYYSKTIEMQFQELLTGNALSEVESEAIWDEQHAKGATKLAETITSLKGFYVKTAQIIASR